MTRKKKKNNPNRWYIRVLLGVLIVACVILIGAVVMFNALFDHEFMANYLLINYKGDEATTAIELALGTTIPDSATNLYYYDSVWQDYFMRIRVGLPADEVQDFLNSVTVECLQQPLQDNITPPYSIAAQEEWWLSSNTTSYVGISQCGNNPYWSLVIDQSDPDVWILYILSFST